MSKSAFTVSAIVGGAVAGSFFGAFKTVDQRLKGLSERQEQVNRKLKAAGDVVKYGGAVERLTARQQRMGRSNARLDRVLGDVTRRYKAATREARSYGIEVGQVTREQARLQRELKATVRMQKGLRMQQQAGGFLRDIRGRALAAGAAVYGVGAAMRRAMAIEEQSLFLGTVINAPDRGAAVERARAHAREQTRTTLASESEMLQIEYSLNSAGLEEAVARAGSGVVHRVATVTRGSAPQVGAIMGVAFNNLAGGMEGTADEKMRRIGDVLAKTQFMYQIEDFGGLGAGLEQGAKAAVNYKVSLEQTAAALGVLNSAGQQGSAAGTAFAATLRSLGKAADEYGTELVRDEKGQLDLIATIGQLRDALADLPIDERAAELQRMFGDEGLAGIGPLMEQLASLGAGVEAVSEAARRGLVDIEYKRFLEDVTGQWTVFRNNVALVGRTFAGTLLPALNAALGPMVSMAVWVGKMIERVPALGYVVGGLAAGLAGLVTVLAVGAGVKWAVGAAMALWPGRLALATAATKAWTAAMWVGRAATLAFNLSLLANPVGLVVAAIAAGAALVVKYWEPLKAFFGGVARGIGQALEPLRPAFEWLGSVGAWVGKVFAWIGEVLGSLFGPVQMTSEELQAFGATGEQVGRVIGKAYKVLLTPITAVTEGVGWVLKKLNLIDDEEPAPETPAAAGRGPRRARLGATVAGGLAVAAPVVAAPVVAPPVPDLSPPPPPAFTADLPSPPSAPSVSRGPTTITVTVGDVVIQAPAGADTADVAAEVRREMAAIMREGAVEAGLAEFDDPF